MTNIDDILRGLALEKKDIAMVDEMARRVGVDQQFARDLLAAERVLAKQDNRKPSMATVARAIKLKSEYPT